jgi:hypothetical protein
MLDLRCFGAIRALAPPQARNKAGLTGIGHRGLNGPVSPHARSSWAGSPVESERLEGVRAFDHPRYKVAAKALVRACARNKKAAGFLLGDVKTGQQYLDWGFRVLAYGTDTGVFQGALKAGIDGLCGRKS